jgi:hypothetical protein
MDLKKSLELGQSRIRTAEIVDYVNGNPKRFKQLVEVFVEGPYRVTQRASWVLTYCVEYWPYLVDPQLKILLKFLEKPGVADAVTRNILRLLQFVEIPKRHQGRVADLCFRFLRDRKIGVAIRVFAMTVLTHIARENPELRTEIKLILEDQMPHRSAAFKSRGKKVLKELSR